MNRTASSHAVTPLDDSMRAARARTLLNEAEHHLAEAREALWGTPPRVQEALPHVLAACRAALRAMVAWNGIADAPALDDGEQADLADLVARAAHFANALRTPAHRLLQLDGRASAIMRSAAPTVYEREEVEVGWYAARNLYRAVSGELSWLLPEAAPPYTSA